MKKWPGKYIIGLTGNIGTGKSVVRRMLEHLGAYGIDADALSHRAISKGAPGYNRVIETFGRYILTQDGEIDRAKLGKIVFSDPAALQSLEAILHPLVNQAIDYIVRRASQKVVVIEAIKIIESGLAEMCNSIWVVYAPEEIQLMRLTFNRGMSQRDAMIRINGQPSQDEKLKTANVIIKNVSSFENTWYQVTQAWQKYVSTADLSQAPGTQSVQKGNVSVQRGGPRQVKEITELYNRLLKPNPSADEEKIMAALGEKAFLVLKIGAESMGFLGWQVENLVARTTQIALEGTLSPAQYLPIMIREMERASTDLQCEISLVNVPDTLALHDSLWKNLGYEKRGSRQMGVLAWDEAAEEMAQPGSELFFKQLRQDRVVHPI